MIAEIWRFIDEKPVLFGGLVAALTLGSAFAFQFAGYPPCDLCWTQRYPYMAIIGITIGSRIIKLPQAFYVFMLLGLFLFDAGVAGYHAGVEYKWWAGPDTCTGVGILKGDDPAAALKAILEAPIVRCDEVPWSLAGISMAGYNFLIASVMTLLMGRALIKSLKENTNG